MSSITCSIVECQESLPRLSLELAESKTKQLSKTLDFQKFRVYPSLIKVGRRSLPALASDNFLDFLCFGVLPVKCREMFILKFLLTFRLAIDARLHQKTELRVENRP